MRPAACFPNSIHGFLIMLALPLVGEMFTGIGFATVPAATRRLPQPSALRMSDLPRQMVADSLIPRELNEFMRAARYEHQQLSKLRKNTNRRSPWGVQVKTSEGTTWLDPAKDEGWDQVEEILEANPRCLERRSPSGKGLLERLPLSSWKGQALQAAKDGTEPPYLKILSQFLSFKLASIVELTPPPPSTANLPSRKVKAAQTLLSMYSYLWAATDVAWSGSRNAVRRGARDAAWAAASGATLNAAIDAAREAAWHAAREAAWHTAVNTSRDAAVNAATNAATNAANEAITQLVTQSPADAPPSAELIEETAYRSAELTAQLSMLKQVEAIVRRIFAQTERFFSEDTPLRVFANLAGWKNFKNQHFSSMDDNIVHYWQPWLLKIDQCVDHTDYPASSARTLLVTLKEVIPFSLQTAELTRGLTIRTLEAPLEV